LIEFEEESEYSACIKVVGVGGAGGTVVDRVGEWGRDIELLAVNADGAALKRLHLRRKVRIGARLTKGLGCGGNPDTGREAAEQEKKRLGGMLAGADLVFIVAGLGGGTGTGAGPVIAEFASELGAITVAVVTKPFLFEGIKKGEQIRSCLMLSTKPTACCLRA
jgi:cell division protein FtsZ